jgi:REP element-mobilizing transposase RayT
MIRKNRQTTRIQNYNYSTAGKYFVTFCTWQKTTLLGRINNAGIVELTENGRFVEKAIQNIDEHYQNISQDAYCIMPNHVHVLITIQPPAGYIRPNIGNLDSMPNANIAEPTVVSISDIVRNLKSYTANKFYKVHKYTLWQRGFYDHIVRSEKELQVVQEYFLKNPQQWRKDKFYMFSDGSSEL